MKTKTLITSLLLAVSLSLTAQKHEGMTEFNPIIRDVDEMKMVYYQHTGAYDQAFNEFNLLMAHIQSNNIPMGPYSLGVYYDDPETVPENELRSEIGYMTTSGGEETELYKYKIIPAGKAVSVKYHSMEEIYPAYEALAKYIKDNELSTEAYSIEIYYSYEPGNIDTEILMLLKN